MVLIDKIAEWWRKFKETGRLCFLLYLFAAVGVVGFSFAISGCANTCDCTRTIIKDKVCEPCPKIDCVSECINMIGEIEELKGAVNHENIS